MAESRPVIRLGPEQRASREHWALPCPVLHPLALAEVSETLGWAPSQALDVASCRAYVLTGPGTPPAGAVFPIDALPDVDHGRWLRGADGLELALLMAGSEAAGDWPLLRSIPLPDESFRRTWHGLNVLYAKLFQVLRRTANAQAGRGYLSDGDLSNLQFAVGHLFVNGDHGVVSCRTAEGERPTLSKAEPLILGDGPPEPACTSLRDVARALLPKDWPLEAALRGEAPALAPTSPDEALLRELLWALGLTVD